MENLETEENNIESQDRHLEVRSLCLESAGMGESRTKSFSVTGMGSQSTRANAGFGKLLFSAFSSIADTPVAPASTKNYSSVSNSGLNSRQNLTTNNVAKRRFNPLRGGKSSSANYDSAVSSSHGHQI